MRVPAWICSRMLAAQAPQASGDASLRESLQRLEKGQEALILQTRIGMGENRLSRLEAE
jgi:hypothetical protein